MAKAVDSRIKPTADLIRTLTGCNGALLDASMSVDALNLPLGDVGVGFDVNAPDRLPLMSGRSVE
jgi:hypothetical protein